MRLKCIKAQFKIKLIENKTKRKIAKKENNKKKREEKPILVEGNIISPNIFFIY